MIGLNCFGALKSSDADHRRDRAPGISGRAAFSVIELLVAMVILLVIVAVFARFFQRSTQSWESGMRTVETSIAGRSALNLIIRDLERAVADPVLVDELFDDGIPAFAISSSEIAFIALATRPPYRVQRLRYHVNSGGELIRSIWNIGAPTFVDTTVIDNVVSIAFAPEGSSDDQLPDEVRVRLRLSNRYDDMPARNQVFVGRAFPVHRARYPGE